MNHTHAYINLHYMCRDVVYAPCLHEFVHTHIHMRFRSVCVFYGQTIVQFQPLDSEGWTHVVDWVSLDEEPEASS